MNNDEYTYRIFTSEHGSQYRLLDDPFPFRYNPAEEHPASDRSWQMPGWCPICKDISGGWSYKYYEHVCTHERLRKPRKWANLKEHKAVVPIGPLQAPLVTSQDRIVSQNQSIFDIDWTFIDREVRAFTQA